jgi:hypothetical protein
MSENSTCLGSGQGVGPVGRPSTMRIGASGLSGKPNRVSMSLQLAAIWGMSVRGSAARPGVAGRDDHARHQLPSRPATVPTGTRAFDSRVDSMQISVT